MQWADFLAMASDLQLVPRIVSVDDLKQAVEHVFAAPHRKLPGREQVSVCSNDTLRNSRVC